MPKHDNFLADAINSKDANRVSYTDGFRFGFGFFVAGLLVTLLVGGLAWGIILAFNLH